MANPCQSLDRSRRGFALIAVMALGAVAMLGVTGLLGEGSVTERRAQEEELLKLRAYWAAQGHIAYSISRMTQGPPCGNKCNNISKREAAFDGFYDELITAGGVREWSYPEVSASYTFPVDVFADFSQPHVTAEISFPAAATSHPLISQVWPVNRAMQVLICSGVASAGDPCPSSSSGLDRDSGISFISSIVMN